MPCHEIPVRVKLSSARRRREDAVADTRCCLARVWLWVDLVGCCRTGASLAEPLCMGAFGWGSCHAVHSAMQPPPLCFLLNSPETNVCLFFFSKT